MVDENHDIVWMDWLLQSKGLSKGFCSASASSSREMFFILTDDSLDCFSPPQGVSRKSTTVNPKRDIKDLKKYGFIRKSSIKLCEILYVKSSENSLQLVTTAGRLYISGNEGDKADTASIDMLGDRLFSLGVDRRTVRAGFLYRYDYELAEEPEDTMSPGGELMSASQSENALEALGSPRSTGSAPLHILPTAKALLERSSSAQEAHAERIMQLEADNAKTREEARIMSMHKMVEEVTVTTTTRRTLKQKVLYLTNGHCDSIKDEASIERCLQALDLGKPRCVIRLLSAEGGVVSYKVHTETRGYVLGDQEFGSDLNNQDAEKVAERLDKFMREVLLPIAKQNRALIICSGCNDDALAAALERVVVKEQLRLGQNCPFKILTFVWSFEVHYNAVHGVGIAGQVAKHCSDWAVRLDKLSEYMANDPTEELQRCDMIESASRVIVFEAYDNGTAQWGPSMDFHVRLLEALTRQQPSIAIQIYATDYSLLSDLVQRGVPVLLLDCRERAITKHSSAAVGNAGVVTNLADAGRECQAEADKLMAAIANCQDDGAKLRAKHALLKKACEIIISQIGALTDSCIVDYDETSSIALIHAALWYGTPRSEAVSETVPLYMRIKERDLLENGEQRRSVKLLPAELVEEAARFLVKFRRTAVTRAKLAQVQKWLKDHGPTSNLAHCRGAAMKWEKSLQKNIEDAENNNGEFSMDNDIDNITYITDVLNSKLTFSGSIFNDADVAHTTITTMLKLNRLPKDTSLRAMCTIQGAWDLVESFHYSADRYKLLTKILYALLLFASIIAAFVPVFRKECGESCKRAVLLTVSVVGTLVLACFNFWHPSQHWKALRGSAVQLQSEIWKFRTRSGIYRVAPDGSNVDAVDEKFSQRIQKLKEAVAKGTDMKVATNAHRQNPPAEEAQQESYCGHYSMVAATPADCAAPEEELAAAMSAHAYGSFSPAQVNHRRGAHAEERRPAPFDRNNSGEGTPLIATQARPATRPVPLTVHDDHYSPLQPDTYIKLRINRAIEFYTDRQPTQNAWSRAGVVATTLSSVFTIVLSAYNCAEVVVVVAIFVTSIMTWLEFQGTKNKIKRYEDVISNLENLRDWWKGLPPVEQNAAKSIDLLVSTGEKILVDDMHTWRSTSASQEEMLQRAARDNGAQEPAPPRRESDA